jgi:hypothetical protein
MFLRTTVIDAEPARLDLGIAFVRDRVQPLVKAQDGSLGLTFAVHRPTGRTVISTLWRTQATVEASRRLLASVKEEAAQVMEGAATPAEEWEVAELYRQQPLQPGCATRTTRLTFDPGDGETLVETFRTTAVPSLAVLDGFTNTALVIDLEAGTGLTLVTFTSRELLEASRRPGAEIRQMTLDKARARAVEVLEAELAMSDLHLPDQA